MVCVLGGDYITDAPRPKTRVVFDKTADADGEFRLISDPLYYYDLTVWILTEDCYIGTGNVVVAPLQVGDIYSDRNGDLAELFFKNYSTGNNTHIVAMVTIPNEIVKKALGWGAVCL